MTVLLGKFWHRFNWQGCIAALVAGSSTSLTIILTPEWSAKLGNPVIPALAISLVCAVVVTLITPKINSVVKKY
ncbi:Predicted symporter [Providencia rettgeri]|uniref:Predicted symporter n=1 Tax=Providencia rettgeri TaxID=587 RepID=A0A379FWT8_PRORE|nr:Predicted symporter [Providencia rettgeri]